MLHIDVLTFGNEFKDSQGNIYKVTTNYPTENSIEISLTKVEQQSEFKEELEPPI